MAGFPAEPWSADVAERTGRICATAGKKPWARVTSLVMAHVTKKELTHGRAR
jgi:hypothetical protein